jgi:SAM-dependent methyltransferase
LSRVLELGCGNRPDERADVRHDRIKHHDFVDVAHDLNLLPWPWADNEFDLVVAYDVFEHLKVPIADWLNECWRILSVDGVLDFRVAAWDNPVSYRDPTHERVFHEETFLYWDPREPLHWYFGSIYFAEADRWWFQQNADRSNADPRYGIGDLHFCLQKKVLLDESTRRVADELPSLDGEIESGTEKE